MTKVGGADTVPGARGPDELLIVLQDLLRFPLSQCLSCFFFSQLFSLCGKWWPIGVEGWG